MRDNSDVALYATALAGVVFGSALITGAVLDWALDWAAENSSVVTLARLYLLT